MAGNPIVSVVDNEAKENDETDAIADNANSNSIEEANEKSGNPNENGDFTTTTPTEEIEIKKEQGEVEFQTTLVPLVEEVEEEGTQIAEEIESVATERSESPTELWRKWISAYKWVLHESADGDFAQCLYCDVRLLVCNAEALDQHEISLYHQERLKNFQSFIETEDQAKNREEFETILNCENQEDRMVKLKDLRGILSKPLAKFNWECWYSEHNWLRRENNEGTIGFCEVCKLAVNVEFKYLRKKHAGSAQHLENVKNYYNQIDNSAGETKTRSAIKRKASESSDKNHSEKSLKTQHLEKQRNNVEIPSNPASPSTILCKLCNTKVLKNNFARHEKTLQHLDNLNKRNNGKPHAVLPKVNIKREKQERMQSELNKLPAWLTVDSSDSAQGYCTVCEKRFMYSFSAVKRQIHENSHEHKQRARMKSVNTAITSDEFSYPEVKDHLWLQSSPELPNFIICNYCNLVISSQVSPSSHEADVAHVKASEEHTKQVNTMKSTRKNSWLCYSRNNHIVFCKYCSERLPSAACRFEHEESADHKRSEKQYFAIYRKKLFKDNVPQSTSSTEKRVDELLEASEDDYDAVNNDDCVDEESTSDGEVKSRPTPTSIQAKILNWKNSLPWLSYKRNETRENYGWCTLCEIAVFVPTYKVAKNHQRTRRHIWRHLRKCRETKATGYKENDSKYNNALKQLQRVYKWAKPCIENPDYCTCSICSIRLSLRPSKMRKHNASRYHQANASALKVQQPASEHENSDGESSKSKTEVNTHATITTNESVPNATATTARNPTKTSLQTAEGILNGIAMLAEMLPRSAHCVSRESANEQPNPIDTYTDYLCKTFKAMPPHLFLYAKSKFGPILQECEERHLREQMGAEATLNSTAENTSNNSLTDDATPKDVETSVVATNADLAQPTEALLPPAASQPNATSNVSNLTRTARPMMRPINPSDRMRMLSNITSSGQLPPNNNYIASNGRHSVQTACRGGPINHNSNQKTVKYTLVRSATSAKAMPQRTEKKEYIRCVPVSTLTVTNANMHRTVISRTQVPPLPNMSIAPAATNKGATFTKLIRINSGGQSKVVAVPSSFEN